LKSAYRTVAVARWLESVSYPAVRIADLGISQPVVVDSHAIIFWEAVSDEGDEYASTSELAEILAKLHALTAPVDLGLPPLRPFDRAAARIAESVWLGSEDREFLTGMLVGLRGAYADLSFALPRGIIHGDANVGNVLRDFGGKPVVIDLDGFAMGPREWDLALTAIYYDSFGWHTSDDYKTFVRAYGYDIMQWPGYPVMRAVREFLMTAWVTEKAVESDEAADEARKRITALRTGASRKDWRPL
jgi:aminoglycoside phosphotransferase (APT) family kinase protein